MLRKYWGIQYLHSTTYYSHFTKNLQFWVALPKHAEPYFCVTKSICLCCKLEYNKIQLQLYYWCPINKNNSEKENSLNSTLSHVSLNLQIAELKMNSTYSDTNRVAGETSEKVIKEHKFGTS